MKLASSFSPSPRCRFDGFFRPGAREHKRLFRQSGARRVGKNEAHAWPQTFIYSLFYGLCKDVLGNEFTRDFIDKKMLTTMKKYGQPNEYKGTRVIVTHGSVDPMHILGVDVPASDDSQIFHFNHVGEASGGDLLPAGDGVAWSPSMSDFHASALDTIKRWLAEFGDGAKAARAEL